MTQIKLDYYKESGIASPLNILLVMIFSVISILILSFIYSLATRFLSIIYFNFFLTIGYGFSISFVSRIFTILFKIRNRKKTIIINIVLAVFAVYSQWVCYLFILSFETIDFSLIFKDIGFLFKILLRPDLVALDLIDISKIGLWSLGSSNTNIRGLMLFLVWIAEAGVIIYLAWNNFRQFNIIPFSEKDNNWFRKQIVDFDFERIAFKKEFIEDFAKNPYKGINELKRGDGLRYSKITLHTSDTETKNIISIDNVIVRERGKGSKEIINVLNLCYVDSLFSSQLKAKHRTKKASIFDQ